MVLRDHKIYFAGIILFVGLYSVIGQYLRHQTFQFDHICQHRPNFTALWQSYENQTQDPYKYKQIDKCLNETDHYFKFTLSRYATRRESRGCADKCFAVAEGITDKNGNLNEEALKKRLKVMYSFSNAKADYIEHVSNTLASCVGIAGTSANTLIDSETSLQNLKSNRTLRVGECEIYNHYDNCFQDIWDDPQNTADNLKAKYCPEQIQRKTF